jgi:hypothetical protein
MVRAKHRSLSDYAWHHLRRGHEATDSCLRSSETMTHPVLPISNPANLVASLGTLGGAFTVALGINNSGFVVGYTTTASGAQEAWCRFKSPEWDEGLRLFMAGLVAN